MSGHRGSRPGSTACGDTQAPAPPSLHCVHEAPRRYQPCFRTLHVGTGFSHPPHLPAPQRQSLGLDTCPWPFPGHLYSSPGLSLNVPSHQHVPKKPGLNEITAQHERPHSSYANSGQWLRGGFPSCWLHSGRKTRSLRDTIKDSFRKYIEQ